MGREAAFAGGRPDSQIFATQRERRVVQSAVDEAMALAGVRELRKAQAGLLSTGQRRLVELARALAGPFELLLLDEPSSGLDATESAHFGEVLRRVVQERGIGILLVEHDMTLVREVCNYVYVLDFGAQIFEGPPDQMQTSDVVKAAYLGRDLDSTPLQS
jgi:ABC-type branched-subunit amino acid transport system ATPase component